MKQIMHAVEQLHFTVAPLRFSDQNLQLVTGLPRGSLCTFACGDVANVALNDVMAVFRIDVADKLHFAVLSLFGLERQVFVTDIAFLLQFSKSVSASCHIREQADFPEFLPH